MRNIKRVSGAVLLAVMIYTSTAFAGDMPCIVDPPPQTTSTQTADNSSGAVDGNSVATQADGASLAGAVVDGLTLLLSVL